MFNEDQNKCFPLKSSFENNLHVQLNKNSSLKYEVIIQNIHDFDLLMRFKN